MPDENPIYSQYQDAVIQIARHWFIERKCDKDVKHGLEPSFSLSDLARLRIRDRKALDSILERTPFRYTYLDFKIGQEIPLDSPEAVKNWVELLELEFKLRSLPAVENRIRSILQSQLAPLSQPGEGKGQETPGEGRGGETNQDVNKSTPTAKLVVTGKTRGVNFNATPYNDLPATSFKFLYTLANTPNKTVPNDTFLSLTPRATKRDIKNISKHIGVITDRIRPLKPFIKNTPEIGYYLDLPTEDVRIVQRDDDIDRILK